MTQLKHFAVLYVALVCFITVAIAQPSTENNESISQTEEAGERILIVSGGGARGAWGGGLAKALVTQMHYDYKVVIGSSTGSLLAPFIALKEFDVLKEGYTSITDRDIFNVKPYKTKGEKRGKIKGFQSFLRLMIGKKTLGESKNLKKTIRNFYTEQMFNQLKTAGSDRQHIATVVNLTKDSVEYKSSKDFEYEEMVDWVWASANAPVFMSLYKMRDSEGRRRTYVDGGVKEGLPLQKGIQIACQNQNVKYIDVIVHSTLLRKEDDVKTGGVVKLLGRIIELFLSENRQNDLSVARKYEVLQNNCDQNEASVTLTYYFMPEEVNQIMPNELLFDKVEMTRLWELGEKHLDAKQPNERLNNLKIQITIPRSQLCDIAVWNARQQNRSLIGK